MATYTVNGTYDLSNTVHVFDLSNDPDLEVSYVNFQVVVGGTVTIRASNPGGLQDAEIHLFIKNPDGTMTLVASNDDSGPGLDALLSNINLAAGEYIIAVNPNDFTATEAQLGVHRDLADADIDSPLAFTVSVEEGTATVNVHDGTEIADADFFVGTPGPFVITAESLLTDAQGQDLSVITIRYNGAAWQVGDPGSLAVEGGTAIIDANGDIVFTPTAGYTGNLTLIADVTDGPGGGFRTVAWTATVRDVIAQDDSGFNGTEDAPFNVAVLANDVNDAQAGGTLRIVSVSAVTDVENGVVVGSAVINDNGTPANFADDFITVTPNANYFGTYYFTYLAQDSTLTTAPEAGTATGNIANVNDVYVAVDDGSDPGAPGAAGGFNPFAGPDGVPGNADDYVFNEDTQFNGDVDDLLTNDINPDGDEIIVDSISNLFDSVTGLQVGTIAYNSAAGTFVITPNANYNGNAFFDYVARDTNGTPDPNVADDTLDTGRVFVTVTPVNDAPTPGAAQANAQTEDQDLNFDINDASDLPAGAPDEDDTPFDYQLVSGSVFRNGVAVGNGTITIIDQAPRDADYNYNDLTGLDQTLDVGESATVVFQYVVRDAGADGISGNGDDAVSAPQTVTLTINGVNDAPVAVDDNYATAEDTTLPASPARNVLANDTDVDVEPLSVVAAAGNTVAGGTYQIFADGTFTYTPPTNFNGNDSFNYTVSDGTATDVGTVNIAVAVAPDAPTAVDDGPFDVNEDVPGQATGLAPGGFLSRTNANGFFSEAQLLGNDTDPDLPGDTLDLSSVGSPVGGTVQLVTLGGIEYAVFTPLPNFSGLASFDYAVTDSTGNTDIGRVFLEINEIADGPPVATNDTVTVNEQETTTIFAADLLANDTDPDNAGAGAGTDQLFVRAIQDLVNARFSAGADGIYNTADDGNFVRDADNNIISFEIESLSDQNGLDASFSYVVDDSAARPASVFDPRVPGQPDVRTGTDIGTVTLDVTPEQDAPIANTDNRPAINEDSAGTTFTQANLLANDSDPDNAGGSNAGLTVVSVAGLTPGSGASVAVTGGTLTANANGTFTFVPSANFFGTATFDYVITDPTGLQDTGTVNIPVTSVNDAPVGGTDGVLPVGLLQLANFAGSPVPGQDGNDPISPGAPLVVEDQSATFTWFQLLANDSVGPANETSYDELRITGGSSAFGTVQVFPGNQTVVFTPTPGYVGPATFTYTLSDSGTDGIPGNGDDLTTNVTVNVNVVDNVPLSADDDVYNAGAAQSVQVQAGAGNDTVNGTAAIDQLFGQGGNDTLNGAGGNDYLYGGAGNNTLNGGDGNDSFYINGGGTDTVTGGAGNDAVFAGNDLTVNDSIDLGTGVNSLAIQGGGYAAGYQFGANNLVNVQNLVVASGQVTGLWPNPVGPGPFDYNLIIRDANIAAGTVLTIIANGLGAGIPGLQAGEDLTIDATDEKNGSIRVFAGQGNDNVQGTEQNDGVFFETGAWSNAGHSFDGRNGNDTIAFRGDYDGGPGIILNGVVRVENVVLLSEDQTQFGGQDLNNGAFDYEVTTVNSNTAAGSTLRIDGFFLNASETLEVDANAELDANLIIFGGAANDTLSGGLQTFPVFGLGGTDLIYGGLGGDLMDGGSASGSNNDGVNVYGYTSAAESRGTSISLAGIDRISGFDWTQDKLDINAGGPATNGLALGIAGLNVTDTNAVNNGNLSLVLGGANDFHTNLAAQIDAFLDPGQGALLRVTSGGLGGSEVFVADTNGNGSYDVGVDLVVIFDNTTSQLPPNADWII